MVFAAKLYVLAGMAFVALTFLSPRVGASLRKVPRALLAPMVVILVLVWPWGMAQALAGAARGFRDVRDGDA